MPTEVRRIIFSNAELYAALDRHLAGTGSGLPTGTISQVWGDASHDLIKIHVVTNENDREAPFEFPVTEVGEALIGHCLTSHIPLPRNFAKSLIITGDKAALEITNASGGLVTDATTWMSIRRRLIETLATLSARKLSLVRASVYGLAFQILVIWLSDRAWGADQWGRVSFDLDSGTWQGIAIAVTALLPGPSLFVIGAWIRNATVKRGKRPFRYSPKTLDFRIDEHRQAAPLSTMFFASALAFSIVVLGGPLVVSQLEQALQSQQSTPSNVLSSPTPGGAFSSSPSAQSSPVLGSRAFGTGFSASSSSGSGSARSALMVQKGTIRLSGSSPVEVIFPKRFGGTPDVVLATAGSPSAGVLPRVESVTPTSFVVRRASGETKRDLQTEFEWVARGPSPE